MENTDEFPKCEDTSVITKAEETHALHKMLRQPL